jgi:hypothetical protein
MNILVLGSNSAKSQNNGGVSAGIEDKNKFYI